MTRIEVPVLVVGGGPIGLLGGTLLARQGLESLVVERRSGLQPSPAAHVVNARTFEICRAAGVDMEAVRAASIDPADGGWAIWVTTLAGEEVGRLRFERQGEDCLEFTPTPLRNLSQHRFEPILLQALRDSTGTDIRYGHEWEGAEQDASGVTSRVRDLVEDRVYEVRSQTLIGADGAGSRVRKWLGIEMEGPQRLQSFLMIHFQANLRELVGQRPGTLYWLCDPEAGGIFIAHDIDRDWVYMHGLDPERESGADYTEARCRRLVERALGTDAVPFEIRTRSEWTMSAQVAERFRDGRVFLAGDSAHRFPPTGGLGLNSGAQDVHGLAWKLGAVARGWAPEILLDTYELERRPVARYNADQSLRNASRLIEVPKALGVLDDPSTRRMQATLADPAGRRRVEAAIAAQAEHFDMLGLQLGFTYVQGALVPDGSEPPATANPVRDYVPSARPGARLPHAWLERDGVRCSTLDLLRIDGFTLVSWRDDGAWADAAKSIEGMPLAHVALGSEIRDVDERWAAVSQLQPGGAVLVRPDQHVAWRARSRPTDAKAALHEAIAGVLWGPGR